LAGKAETDEQKKLQEAGKGFESLLVGKLIDSMRKSIPDGGLLEDSASKQVEDMFWHFMGQEIGHQGGIGLWKELVAEAKGAGASSDNVPVGDGKEHPDDHGISTTR
jgi:Rod binding domain-containing protein